MRHVAKLVHVEVLGVIRGEIAVGRDIDTEIFERLNGGTEVNHLVVGTLVGRVHQGVGGQPAVACTDVQDVGLSAEHEQESGSAALLGMADQRGRIHITGQHRTATLGVGGRHVAQRHQQAHRTVQNDTADIRLVDRVILTPFLLALFHLFGQLILGILVLASLTLLVGLLIVTAVLLQDALVHLLEIRNRIVQRHKVQRGIALNILRVLDGVAQVREGKRGGLVLIHRGVAHVGGYELEERNLVDRHLVGGAEVLAVVGGAAAPAEAVPHGVALDTRVNTAVRLVDARGSVSLELQPQTLENIPVDGIVTCPVERLHVVGVDDDIAPALRPILELLHVAVEGGAEHKVLRHRSDVEVLDDLQPFIVQPFDLR